MNKWFIIFINNLWNTLMLKQVAETWPLKLHHCFKRCFTWRWQRGGSCNWGEFALGGYVTNGATPSSLYPFVVSKYSHDIPNKVADPYKDNTNKFNNIWAFASSQSDLSAWWSIFKVVFIKIHGILQELHQSA